MVLVDDLSFTEFGVSNLMLSLFDPSIYILSTDVV